MKPQRIDGARTLLAWAGALSSVGCFGLVDYGSTGAGGSDASGGQSNSGGEPGTGGWGGTGGGLIDAHCAPEGASRCAPESPTSRVLCLDGAWTHADCDWDEGCDPSSGACALMIPECAGREPGDTFCSADDEVFVCGPGLVSATLAEVCEGTCIDHPGDPACAPPFCGDGKVQAVEACDDGNDDDTEECTSVCELGVCGDGITNGPEECDDGGSWDGNCSAACTWQVVELVSGPTHNCARRGDGAVKCWGLNNGGNLGLGDWRARGLGPGEMGAALPTVDLGSGRTATALGAGGAHTCARLDDGTTKCWGNSEYGQLGLGDRVARGDHPGELGDDLPVVDLGEGRTAVAFAPGFFRTCALIDDGSVKCFGRSQSGELGLPDGGHRGDEPGEMGDQLPAVALFGGVTAVALAAFEHHTCALLAGGSVKCWGRAASGQLGLGQPAQGLPFSDAWPAVDLGSQRTAVATRGWRPQLRAARRWQRQVLGRKRSGTAGARRFGVTWQRSQHDGRCLAGRGPR